MDVYPTWLALEASRGRPTEKHTRMGNALAYRVNCDTAHGTARHCSGHGALDGRVICSAALSLFGRCRIQR